LQRVSTSVVSGYHTQTRGAAVHGIVLVGKGKFIHLLIAVKI
jgi:hypothetical protein